MSVTIINQTETNPTHVEEGTFQALMLSINGVDVDAHNARIDAYHEAAEVIRKELPEGAGLLLTNDSAYFGEVAESIEDESQMEIDFCCGDEEDTCDDCPEVVVNRGGRPRISQEKINAIRALAALNMYSGVQIAGIVEVSHQTVYNYLTD